MKLMTTVAEQSIRRLVDRPAFDVHAIRRDFPILSTTAHGKPLVFLDNGATTQKPRQVIDRIVRYYESENANIHRGVYALSQRATEAFEDARKTVARFIHAADEREVIFVRGTTEAINLVAFSYVRPFLKAGDEIVVSALEHHSDIVPWQMAAEAVGARVKIIPVNDDGELLMDEYDRLLSSGRVKLVAVTHLSNALGTIVDVEHITRRAHEAGAKVLVDGAQWIAHYPTDVQQIGCDFYTFGAHKLYGPTGIGVLWGRRDVLEAMPPFHGGGDMIDTVSYESSTYAGLPNKFEAGTPDICGALALAAAIEYVESVGWDAIIAHEHDLLEYGTRRMKEVPGLRIVGPARNKGGIISFRLENPAISTLDVGTQLDTFGVAVRTGHHCTMPLMDRLKIDSTARATFAMYNTREEIDVLVDALKQIVGRVKVGKKAAPDVQITFAGASGASAQEVAVELASNFELMGDGEGKSTYVIDLGEALPHGFSTLKQLTPRVAGCMSEVYLIARQRPGQPGVIEFAADSNADIVRGLIAVLQKLFSGQPATDVLSFDVEAFFRNIGLDQFITTQRRNGLAGMVDKIRAVAREIVKR